MPRSSYITAEQPSNTAGRKDNFSYVEVEFKIKTVHNNNSI